MKHPNLRFTSCSLIALLGAGAAAADTGMENQPIVLDQVQLGAIISDLEVSLPEDADGATLMNSAVANNGAGLLTNGNLDFDAIQQAEGSVAANTELLGGDVAGFVVSSTTAYGNASMGGTENGSSYYHAEQSMSGDTTADTVIDVDVIGGLSAATVAASNVSTSSATNGNNSAFQIQETTGSTVATSDIDICCDAAGGQVITTASGNVASSTGDSATSINGAVQTTGEGTEVRAFADTYSYIGNNITSATTASGNSYTLDNKWGYTSLGRQGSELFQGNEANVSATSHTTFGTWNGQVTSSAYGVGNTAAVSNIGSDTALHARQNNYGDVSSLATVSGPSNTGGVAQVSAVSIGNGASAFMCTTCGDGILSGNVRQMNTGDITAQAQVSMTGTGSVYGSASAMGNTATFTSSSIGGGD